MRRFIGVFALASLGVSLVGCVGVLPKRHEITTSPFATFSDAHIAYTSVILDKTTNGQLTALGYNPDTIPNVTYLTYLDIIEAFVPRDGLPVSFLPTAVKSCIEALTRCTGYVVTPRQVNKDRVGNVWLDFFDFKRETETTGWEAEAMFVLLDNVVVYKLWSGRPQINERVVETNPLGPIQDAGTLINRAIPTPDY